ncbi:3-isopropylmalate dehydratase small subunit [Streptomyces sp. NPDC002526]
MEPFIVHVGRAVALRRDNIDTDQIVPGEFCKRVTKSGYEDALFARWRKEPGFVLDRPEHRGSSILLAGRDFGIGSSREHAVWALRDGGFKVVVATGFGDIFRRNATNNGLLLVNLPEPAVRSLMELAEKDPGLAVTVDLARCRIAAAGRDWPFAIEPRARRRMLAGEDPIAATLRHADRIAAYERGRADWLPALGGYGAVRE